MNNEHKFLLAIVMNWNEGGEGGISWISIWENEKNSNKQVSGSCAVHSTMQ